MAGCLLKRTVTLISATAVGADRTLRPAITRLRRYRRSLMLSQREDIHHSDDDESQLAVAIQNLIGSTEFLIRVLYARKCSKRDCREDIETAVMFLVRALRRVRILVKRDPHTRTELNAISNWLRKFCNKDSEDIDLATLYTSRCAGQSELIGTQTDCFRAFVVAWHYLAAKNDRRRRLINAIHDLDPESDVNAFRRIDLLTQRFLECSESDRVDWLHDTMLKKIDDLSTSKGYENRLSEKLGVIADRVETHHRDKATTDDDHVAQAEPPVQVRSPEFHRVKEVLTGKNVVLVAGTPKLRQQRNIEEALDVRSVAWIDAGPAVEHLDLNRLLKDADVVIFVPKLIGDRQSEIIDHCDQHGIWCVSAKKFTIKRLVSAISKQGIMQHDRAA